MSIAVFPTILRCRLMLRASGIKYYYRRFSVTCMACIENHGKFRVESSHFNAKKDHKIINSVNENPFLIHAPHGEGVTFKGIKRFHQIQVPECLRASRPQSGKPVYVHAVQFKAENEESESGYTNCLLDLMSNDHNFVILSSKPIPEVCDLSIPTSERPCLIKIKTNVRSIFLTQHQVEHIQNFHCMLFLHYLSVVHDFLQYDSQGEGVSYFVALTKENMDLDWDLMQKYGKEIVEPDYELQCLSSVPDKSLKHSLIVTEDPYRTDKKEVFFVKDITRGRGSVNNFQYFHVCKFKGPIENREKTDFVLRHDMVHNYKLFNFPASIWIKAKLLPPTLLMFELLVGAEELRRDITIKAGIGKLNLEKNLDQHWAPMPWVKLLKKRKHFHRESSQQVVDSIYSYTKEWIAYQSFFKREGSNANQLPQLDHENIRLHTFDKIAVSDLGPQLSDILEVLLSPKEETKLFYVGALGRAFIQLVSVMYVLHAFPSNALELPITTQKIMSNSNIFHAAHAKQFGGRIRLKEKFDDMWLPPCFCVPPRIEKLLNDLQVPSAKLKALHLSTEDQMQGRVSKSAMLDLARELKRSVDQSNSRQDQKGSYHHMDRFLGKQYLHDMAIAHSIWCLVELYLLDGGVGSALKLLKAMQFLPSEINHKKYVIQFEDILSEKAFNLSYTTESKTLSKFEDVEKMIGYTFNNKHLLQEALMCAPHLSTIGDAVHGLLIAIYRQETTSKSMLSNKKHIHEILRSNILMASLAVRYDLYGVMIHTLEPHVRGLVDNFIAFQKSKNHAALFHGFSLEPYPSHILTPKCLADLFEAFVGAIYLDSGLDFNAVWCVIYKLMHKELCVLSKASPIDPISMALELFQRVERPKRINSEPPTVRYVLQVEGKSSSLENIGSTFEDAEEKLAEKVGLCIIEMIEKKLDEN